MVGQKVTQRNGKFVVQTGRGGGNVTLTRNQFKEFQSRLNKSFQKGKNESFKANNPLIKRAISFGFSEGARTSGIILRDILQRQAGQSFLTSKDAKNLGVRPGINLTKEILKSKKQRQFLEATSRGKIAPTKSEIALQQNLPKNLRNKSLLQISQDINGKNIINQTITNIKKNIALNQISPVDQRGIEGFGQKLRGISGKARTKKLRGTSTFKDELILASLVIPTLITDVGISSKNLGRLTRKLIDNPKLINQLPSSILSSILLAGEEFGETIRISPVEATVKVGGEIILLKGIGNVINIIGKAGTKLSKLNPNFLGSAKKGKNIKVNVGEGKFVNVKVIGKLPTENIISQIKRAGTQVRGISTQADNLLSILKTKKLIRKPIPNEAVASIQIKNLLKKFDNRKITKNEIIFLDRLIRARGGKGLLERSFFIDPKARVRPSRLGIVEDVKVQIKRLESKKRLSSSEIKKLSQLKKQQKPLNKFLDLISDDITFRKPKPQILLFEKLQVQKFPKNLQPIIKKLKSGKALTETEGNQLLQFQLKKSGKAKPLGFISKESEITLAPGEVLKKVKKLGFVQVKGKNIPIIQTEVFKPKGKTKALLNKFNKGLTSREIRKINQLSIKKKLTKPEKKTLRNLKKKGLNKSEQKRLDKLLKKQTGFDYGISSSAKSGKKFVDIKKFGVSALSRLSSKARRIKSRKRPSQISRRKKPRSPRRISKSPKRISPVSSKRIKGVSKPSPKSVSRPRIARGISGKSPLRTIKRPPIIPPPIKRKRRVRRKKKIPKKAFNVFVRPLKLKKKGVKKRPKLIKVNRRPLSKIKAKDLRNYITDTSLARTSRIKSTKGKPKRPFIKVPKGFAKKTKKKFRTFKQVRGKRSKLRKGKIIERGKFLLDTRQEKRKIGVKKRLASLNREAIRRTKTKIKRFNPQRRKPSQTQLKNLAKGRKILALKRRKSK